jgi:hypothetical protein
MHATNIETAQPALFAAATRWFRDSPLETMRR